MMKSKVMTYAIIGGIIGFFTDGILVGAGALVLICIAFQLEELLHEIKKE